MNPDYKECSVCKHEKPVSEFSKQKDKRGREYPRGSCRECFNENSKKYIRNPDLRKKTEARFAQKMKERRAAGLDKEKWVLRDSKKGDKKKGFENDLDKDFVSFAINSNCLYCGSKDNITLDRIDNTKGHTKDNVNPCCYRCNMIRRDMPYGAWVRLAETVRIVNNEGLFGSWIGGIKKTIKEYI